MTNSEIITTLVNDAGTLKQVYTRLEAIRKERPTSSVSFRAVEAKKCIEEVCRIIGVILEDMPFSSLREDLPSSYNGGGLT